MQRILFGYSPATKLHNALPDLIGSFQELVKRNEWQKGRKRW